MKLEIALVSGLVLGFFSAPLRADSSTFTAVQIATGTQASSLVFNSTSVIHGIHLTASAAGSKKYRKNRLDPLLNDSIINTVVVDIKEEEGYVYIPGVKMAEEAHAYASDIHDLPAWLADLKKRHVYTIGRVVTFKDNKAPRRFPQMAVHTLNGQVWQDRKGISWLDPYNHQAWRYDLLIALQAAKVGFDEIQFDYIRFPTDGDLKTMRFIKPYSPQAASAALVDFLNQASQLLHPLGTKVSIDVFGLTTSVNTGMGIGQRLGPMAQAVDFVCPMTYPSHYARGEYGIANPNDAPYRTIHMALHDAIKTLGPESVGKLRPYYQDFSLKGRGIRYGKDQVRAQMQAAIDLGIRSWTLWNARCSYTLSALRTPVVAVLSSTSSVVSSTDSKTASK